MPEDQKIKARQELLVGKGKDKLELLSKLLVSQRFRAAVAAAHRPAVCAASASAVQSTSMYLHLLVWFYRTSECPLVPIPEHLVMRFKMPFHPGVKLVTQTVHRAAQSHAGDGFVAGDKLSFADLAIFSALSSMASGQFDGEQGLRGPKRDRGGGVGGRDPRTNA